MIYTLGYASLGYNAGVILPKLVKVVEERESILIDIRSRPWGLVNQNQLKRALGPSYLWYGKDLGFPQYRELAKDVTSGVIVVAENIILMCCEKDHNNCHRKDVALIMQKTRGKNEKIEHLFSMPDNPPKSLPVDG